MKSAIGRSLLPIVLVVTGGLAIAAATYFVTSYAEVVRVLGGPGIAVVVEPGFDPWTGLPHGLVTSMQGEDGVSRVISGEWIPPDYVGRQAIPLPVGFAIGAVVMIGVLAMRSRQRRPATTAVV